jgi:hypothetical protein
MSAPNCKWTIEMKNEGHPFYVDTFAGTEAQARKVATNTVRRLQKLLPRGSWSAGIIGEPVKGRTVTVELTVV